ncbi:MAG TPA: hypothetical protein ENJ06_01785 [Phycisphaeraceae bacterium]|nr:hypothetical protein [Phycisphaeraceae bacterium]
MLALTAGVATASDDTVEYVVPAAADSYNYPLNAPHGGLNYMAMFYDQEDGRRAVGMIAFDVGDLAIEAADIVSARLEFTVGAASNSFDLDGDSGILGVYNRDAAFDESDPNPPVGMTGDALVESLLQVGDLGMFTMESPDLMGLVQQWVADPAQNMGLDLAFDPVAGASDTFWLALRTREWMVADEQPRLVITAAVPAPGSAMLLVTGALSGLKRRRR